MCSNDGGRRAGSPVSQYVSVCAVMTGGVVPVRLSLNMCLMCSNDGGPGGEEEQEMLVLSPGTEAGSRAGSPVFHYVSVCAVMTGGRAVMGSRR